MNWLYNSTVYNDRRKKKVVLFSFMIISFFIYSTSLNNFISFSVIIMLMRCCRDLTLVHINQPLGETRLCYTSLPLKDTSEIYLKLCKRQKTSSKATSAKRLIRLPNSTDIVLQKPRPPGVHVRPATPSLLVWNDPHELSPVFKTTSPVHQVGWHMPNRKGATK